MMPEEEGKAVTSPMVGVFYAAPDPGAEPFVSLGKQVKKGDVLCIVEAMKLMNEILAEEDGVITKISCTNGQTVEYGQELFRMKEA
jgi:acetyl-CoA carboxylase biotin carboxyl carrier protein